MALSLPVSTETDLANLALAHLGQAQISNIEVADPRNPSVTAARQMFQPTRASFQRWFRAPNSIKRADLVLLLEDPDTEHAYAYLYPDDCKHFKRIVSGNRNEGPNDRIFFERGAEQADGTSATINAITQAIEGEVTTTAAHGYTEGQLVTLSAIVGMTQLNGQVVIVADPTSTTFKMRSKTTGEYVDTSGYTAYASAGTATHTSAKRILTDQADAVGEYVQTLSDLSLWDEDVILAWSYLYAWYMAPRVPGINKKALREEMWAAWIALRSIALGNAEDERVPDPPPNSKYTSRRRRTQLPAE